MTPFPDLMNAITVEGGKGPASALKLIQIPMPVPKEDELLIKVHAAGVNRPDVFQRLGFYPPPPGSPDRLGLEIAGEVVKPAGHWQVGDKVCALIGSGGYAEYAVCNPRHSLPIPNSLNYTEAAGLPETVFTVYANIFEHGGLQPNETLMVHGATSGIGVTAIQMAKAAGARVIATARSAEKAKAALSLGADIAVDTSVEDYTEIAKSGKGVDVVLNMVGGDTVQKDIESLNMKGRIVFIASLGGDQATFSVFQLMLKQAVMTGSTLKSRPANEKARLANEVERVVWPWIEAGKVTPHIYKTFPLSEAAAAHTCLEDGAHIGKIILLP